MAPAKASYYPLMDLVRYVLALGVIIAHFNEATGTSLLFIPSYYCVGGFFALSGFLVYPSYQKAKNLKIFYSKRAVRILPAYLFIVLLCAVGLSLVSTLTLSDYFTSPDFWKYLAANLSFLNWLHPTLPGVFDGSEFLTPTVNAALWTMKVDWCLFLTVPLVFMIEKKWRLNRTWLILSIIILSIGYRLLFLWLFDVTGSNSYEILSRQIFGQAAYYYSGILIYFHRERFRKHLWVFVILSMILIFIALKVPYGVYFITPVALSSAVLGVSLLSKSGNLFGHLHNVSYQMYLFHYPLIKLLIYFNLASFPPLISLTILLIPVVLLSFFSQHCIEIPLIKRFK